jgi:hypothetical protein
VANKSSCIFDSSIAKPNFFVIGAQHCATTSLCFHLGQHNDILICREKEPHFFSVNEVYDKGWEWYLSLFSQYTGEKAIGEGSTTYSMSLQNPKAPARIARTIPDANIIYIVRNPIKRIESAYQHRLLSGRKCWDFNSTIKKVPGIIDNTLYWKQINRYRDYFSDDQIKIIYFEDFIRNPELILRKCFKLLEVNSEISMDFTSVTLNQSDGQFYYNFVGRLLKKVFIPLCVKNSDQLKNKLKSITKGMLMNRITGKPKLRPEIKQWVIDAVYKDSLSILEYSGKDESYWDFNSNEA